MKLYAVSCAAVGSCISVGSYEATQAADIASYALTGSVRLTADYQLIVNPGYNTDRGPVFVGSIRLHIEL